MYVYHTIFILNFIFFTSVDLKKNVFTLISELPSYISSMDYLVGQYVFAVFFAKYGGDEYYWRNLLQLQVRTLQ